MDADRDVHYHVLEMFGDAAADVQKVGLFEGFESEARTKVR
jgi:hypothetical protein